MSLEPRTPALLEVRGATRHFTVRTGPGRTGTLHAVDDVNLTLRRGMIIGLVGESGSGKTTIARLVALFYPLTAGAIELEGRPAPADKGRRADSYRDQVQLMFQDPFGSLNVVHTVGYTLGRVLRLHGFRGSRAQLRKRMIALLQQVRLEPAADYLGKYPYQMSGGQRQRVVLARALAVGPKIILADEPVSMLDVSIRAEMLNLFADLRDRTGLSLLYVTHDMAGARYLCDEIAVMYAGQIVEQGSAEDVVVRPSHPYTRLLIESSPDPTRAERESRDERFGSRSDLGEPPNVIDPAPGCRFAPRCPYADATCRTVDPPQVTVAPGRTSRCWLHDPSRRDSAPDWVRASGAPLSPLAEGDHS
ncbi:ABC transporter ATP-binding protein [Microbacteriaceae bacterium VKM Ac-2854]|nr:ABC transporter ATP-binding protein [Microbacteriaceae bacterium VKM Ac-2854]